MDHKVITNSFVDPVTSELNKLAQRRGNSVTSEVTRYSSLTESINTEIDRTFTYTTEYDSRGNAVWSQTDTFVVDRVSDPGLLGKNLLPGELYIILM